MTDQMTRLLTAARPAQFRPGTPVEPATRDRELATVFTAAHHVTGPTSHVAGQHALSAAQPDRRRRRAALLTASGLAVAAGLVLGLSAVGAYHSAPRTRTPGTPVPGAQTGSARLAGWTVRTNPDGTVTMTLRQLADGAELRRVLAAHGVPAIVYVGANICQEADGDGPPGLDRVVSHPRSGGNPWDTTVIVIRPAAIPRRTELLFDIMPNSGSGLGGVGTELIYVGARIDCQPPPQPSTAPSPVLTPPAKG